MFKNQKGFAPLILIIAVMVLVGIGAYFWKSQKALIPVTSIKTQTPQPSTSSDPTTVWKTYTNTKYKYLLKLPENYSALDPEFNLITNPENAFYISFLKYTTREAKLYKDDLRDKAYYNSITILIQGNDPCENLDPKGMISKENLLIDGHKAVKWIGNNSNFGDPNLADVIIHIDDDNGCYKLYYLRDKSIIQDSNKLLDQILSTFKFTN